MQFTHCPNLVHTLPQSSSLGTWGFWGRLRQICKFHSGGCRTPRWSRMLVSSLVFVFVLVRGCCCFSFRFRLDWTDCTCILLDASKRVWHWINWRCGKTHAMKVGDVYWRSDLPRHVLVRAPLAISCIGDRRPRDIALRGGAGG